MFETLSKQQLNAMTSDEYRQNFDGPSGDDFRKRVSELESQPAPTGRKRGSVRGEEAVAPTPGMSSFDPSFDEQPTAPAAAPGQPAAATPAQPAAAPAAKPTGELAVWRYWPTDAQGRKIGGEQVFRFDPTLPPEHEKSLASQLTKSNIHAVRMAKERKVEAVIDEVKQVATGYKPPVFLTREQHPEFEALNAVTRDTINNGTQSAMNAFRMAHPEFVASDSNAVALVRWVEKSGRNPVDAQTWELAWAALKPYLAVEAPDPVAAESVAEVPAPAPAPAPVAATPAPAVRPAQSVGIASGFSNADSTSDGLFVEPTKVLGVKLAIDNKILVMTLAAWDRLPSHTQKRILRNSANAAAVESLFTANDAARQAAARR
jgi:hypothetical protein